MIDLDASVDDIDIDARPGAVVITYVCDTAKESFGATVAEALILCKPYGASVLIRPRTLI